MRKKKEHPVELEIEEDDQGATYIKRTYSDGRIERELAPRPEGRRKRHILGVRKVTVNHTRQKRF